MINCTFVTIDANRFSMPFMTSSVIHWTSHVSQFTQNMILVSKLWACNLYSPALTELVFRFSISSVILRMTATRYVSATIGSQPTERQRSLLSPNHLILFDLPTGPMLSHCVMSICCVNVSVQFDFLTVSVYRVVVSWLSRKALNVLCCQNGQHSMHFWLVPMVLCIVDILCQAVHLIRLLQLSLFLLLPGILALNMTLGSSEYSMSQIDNYH